MVHRAVNIPMCEDDLKNEINRIKRIADVNGYTEQLIDDLVRAHKRKKELRNYTNLSMIRDDDVNGEKKEEKGSVWLQSNNQP